MSNRILAFLKSPRLKGFYIGIGILLVLLLAVGTYAYQKRDALLIRALNKAKSTLLQKYDMDLKVQYYAFRGLNAVQLKNIALLPRNREQLAHIQDLTVSVRLWPLLFGDVKFGEVILDRGAVTLVKKDSLSNYDFLFRKRKDSTDVENPKRNLAALADRLLKSVFFKIP